MCSPHTPSKKEHKMNQEKKCTARGSTIWLIQLVNGLLSSLVTYMRYLEFGSFYTY